MTMLGRRKREAAAKKAEKARRRAEEAARKAREAAEAAERAAREAAEAEAERAAVEGEDEAARASEDDSAATTETRPEGADEAPAEPEEHRSEKPDTADEDDGDGSQKAAADAATETSEKSEESTKTEDDADDEDDEQRDKDGVSVEDGEHDKDEESDEEDDEPERAPGRMRRLVGAIASAGALGYALIAVNVALVAGLVWLAVAVHRADGEEAAADQVKFAASRAAEDLSSYDFRTIDADLKRAADQTTGRFKSQFQQLTGSVRTSATRQQAVVEGTAVKTAVESVDGDRAIALVYLNQQTAKGSSGQRTPSQFAMRLVMRKVGDRWLVSELQML